MLLLVNPRPINGIRLRKIEIFGNEHQQYVYRQQKKEEKLPDQQLSVLEDP